MTLFTGHLKNEHEEIKKRISKLKEFVTIISSDKPFAINKLQEVLTFFELIVGHYHHLKEELMLFPILHNSGQMGQGGPRCSFFMEYKLTDNKNIELIISAEKEVLKDIIASNSALTIPLKEHEACAKELSNIRLLLEKYAEDAHKNKHNLVMAMDSYIQLLELHIEKEDTCLFVQADKILDEDLQKELLKQALQLEDEQYQKEIKKCL